MDAINVHITVKDEPAPRQYIVTGGSFDAMKTTVKATGARFDGDLKSWALPSPGAFDLLEQLRQQYTANELPILRLKRDFDEVSRDVDKCARGHMLNWQEASWSVTTTMWLEVQFGDTPQAVRWNKLPPVPAEIEITPDAAASAAAEMAATGWKPEQIHGLSIARGIVQAELDRRAAATNDRLLELLRQQPRTKANIIEAVKVLLVEIGFVPNN